MIHYFISKQKKAQRVIQWANSLRMNWRLQMTKTSLFRMMTKQEKCYKHGIPENDPCYRKVIPLHTSKINIFTTRHATGKIELRTFVSRNVPNVPKCPEMSQNISSLALVCVHMHTRAHVASLNSGQYKVWFFLRKSLFVPKVICSHWELELDLL